ncbi:LysR family transcriptional regulator [Peribacillus sp. NPDC096448]|uniref:LysR family transcriptional regulator n=1 Tax=Peribacillus sp. NPDC096448 TaxID=3364395 RepID=UPI00382D54FA
MELRQIEYFIEVAKREHMTEAAVDLHVAQSAVSRQIYNLEEELGVPLFIREGRKIRLTPIGHTFLAHMEQAMDIIDRAKREMAESLDPEKGTIRIGFPSSLASYILPRAISDFRESYPQAKFTLKQGSYRYLIDSVIKGNINMALIGPLPVNEKKIKGETLFIENLVALLPESHPLALKKSLSLNELQGNPFILSPKGYVLRDLVMKACKLHGFEPEVAFEGKDTDAIKGLVAAGLGITLIPEISLIDSLPRFTVKLPLEEPAVTRAVGVIVPADRELMPTEKLFYQYLKDTFAKLEGFQK